MDKSKYFFTFEELISKIDSLDNNKLLDNYSFSKKNGINSNIYILSSLH